jgi:hypothetical protein
LTDPTWREKKMCQLCDERHPILSRLRQLRPDVWGQSRVRIASLTDEERRLRRLLAHIHRELDFYEMQIAKPGLDAMREKNRQLGLLLRRVRRLAARVAGPATLPR